MLNFQKMSHTSAFKQYSSLVVVLFILVVLAQNNVSATLVRLEPNLHHPYNMAEAAGNEITMKQKYDLHNEPMYFGGENNYISENDYYDDGLNNEKRSSRIHVFRRGCIRRNGACDNRPNDCCFNSSCRCNLWGSNCRCQRMGLFQKWG